MAEASESARESSETVKLRRQEGSRESRPLDELGDGFFAENGTRSKIESRSCHEEDSTGS